jgi:tetratricopeptide (TPR) repeat protein
MLALRLLLAVVCLVIAGRTVVRNDDWASTEALMQSAARVVPTSAKVHAALGGVALAKEDWSKALEHFHEAMEIYPDYIHTAVTINLNLGTALFKTGQTTEAIQAYERAVELDPGSSVTHFNLALGYAERGLYGVAEKAMRRALALNPEFPEARSGLSSILIGLGRYDEALGEAEAALRLRPDLREARAHRAKALQALGKLDEAAAESKRAGGEVMVPGLMGRKPR